MSDVFELEAVVRSDIGKGASRRLRREQNQIPAIIYGADKEPQMLALHANKVKKALENEAFYSHILTLSIDGKKEQAVLKDLHRNPANYQVMHMDFLRVTGKEAITMKVPLHFINADQAPATKNGGVISHTITELEIKCLPKDLPEFIEVDLSELELDHAVHLSDLKLPKGVELAGHEIDAEHDLPVASASMPREEPVEEEAPSEEAAGEEGEAKGEGEEEGKAE